MLEERSLRLLLLLEALARPEETNRPGEAD